MSKHRVTGRKPEPRVQETAPERARRFSGVAPAGVQVAIAALGALNTELALRVLYDPSAHVFGQRQAEVYGWFSLLALLLVLASHWLRLVAYRRALGLAAFVYALVHVWYSHRHILGGDWENVLFFSPSDQAGLWVGVLALLGLLPLVITSSDRARRRLGGRWKTLHRLGPPMTVLATWHTVWIGVHFGLVPLAWTSVVLLALTFVLFLFRLRKVRRSP
ncbi:ferric reductase-like transmembrane domain-containing protein [Deinococcus peraridilitoris]|uniref:Putative membrane protein n=1 Tax=Deinococcus peraridilitoris (strain DSM 19664 / LMG 22246 / CIP 109416 / KR-200) TaxID=937777 RepID=L0A2B8_DEIPD|nr:ferric reductase-like transmembrane domain-containing protein [Deinococcus peraridilitoris]AFZ67996.1 putative membrane protein [Deinococcus peraridilitoris DSM 19664]